MLSVVFFIVMLSIVILSVIVKSIVMLSVLTLSVILNSIVMLKGHHADSVIEYIMLLNQMEQRTLKNVDNCLNTNIYSYLLEIKVINYI